MRTIRYRAVITATLLVLPLPSVLVAQQRDRDPDVRIERLPGSMSIAFGNANRPVLGLTLAPAGRSDTEGVRVESVDPNGPAARSGIKAGDVITEINDVSLRISQDDAEDPSLRTLGQRRLNRTLAKAKPGDEVELRVRSGNSDRTVSVKAMSAAELDRSTRSSESSSRGASGGSSDDERRGVIGLSIGGSGTARDTLGLFVSSVVTEGPAEKAGIVEGERIAAVNGIDVRLPREDVEDPSAVTARANRFIREVQRVAPGGNVSLRVYSGGRYREVTVRTVRSSDLPSRGFQMSIGDGGMTFNLPRTPNALRSGDVFLPRGNDGTLRQLGPGTIRFNGETIDIDRAAVERAMQELRRNLQERGRELRYELRDNMRDELRDDVRSDSVRARTRTAPTIVRVAPRRATAH